MPRLVRLSTDAPTEAAIDSFGNRARVAILGYLADHGPSTRGEMSDALGIAPATMTNHLRALIGHQLITASPAESRRGQRPRYDIDPVRVLELYEVLGDALRVARGETKR